MSEVGQWKFGIKVDQMNFGNLAQHFMNELHIWRILEVYPQRAPHLVTVGKTVHMGFGRSLRSACECA